MKIYFRVETMEKGINHTVGGYVSIALAVTLRALGLTPLAIAKEMSDALEKTDNINAKLGFRLVIMLTQSAGRRSM